MQKFKIGMVVLWRGCNWVVVKNGTERITGLHVGSDKKVVITKLDERPVKIANTIKRFAIETIIDHY